MSEKQFQLRDDTDGTDVLGRVSEDNVYIKTYGTVVEGKQPKDLEVGESTLKRYALSGTRPTVYRITRVS